jgi:aspartyl-tRNA(Asn)/glutamyl-tRNA(Gln) amidotransferase subunit C
LIVSTSDRNAQSCSWASPAAARTGTHLFHPRLCRVDYTSGVAQELSLEHVRKIAALARLRLDDAQAEDARQQLGKVLGYVARLSELDLSAVEPLTHPGELNAEHVNRLEDDTPGSTLSNEALAEMLPESIGPFGSVPRVLGGHDSSGGGA